MATIPGSVTVTGTLAPTDTSDTYAVTDEQYQKGGYRTVRNHEDMEAIPTERRKDGMLVRIKNEDPDYEFNGLYEYNAVDNSFKPYKVEGGGDVDLSGYYTKEETDKLLDGVEGTGGTYTNPSPTTAAVGGVPAGTTFDNKTMQEVLDMLFYPYQAPAFSKLTHNFTKVFEVGEETPATINIQWDTTNKDNIKPDSVMLYVNNQQVGTANLANSGNETFTLSAPLKLEQEGTITVKATLIDIKEKTIAKQANIVWNNFIFHGNSDSDTIDNNGVAALTKKSQNGRAGTISYPGGGYKIYAYPSKYGEATSFTDAATKLSVPMEKLSNVSIRNNHGVTQEFFVYKSVNKLNGAVNIIVA